MRDEEVKNRQGAPFIPTHRCVQSRRKFAERAAQKWVLNPVTLSPDSRGQILREARFRSTAPDDAGPVTRRLEDVSANPAQYLRAHKVRRRLVQNKRLPRRDAGGGIVSLNYGHPDGKVEGTTRSEAQSLQRPMR